MAEKKSKIDTLEFIELWNSNVSLEEIACQKNVNVQSLRTRASMFRKNVADSVEKIQQQLSEAKSKPNNESVVSQMENNLLQLNALSLRERKGTGRKTGVEALLALASQIKNS